MHPLNNHPAIEGLRRLDPLFALFSQDCARFGQCSVRMGAIFARHKAASAALNKKSLRGEDLPKLASEFHQVFADYAGAFQEISTLTDGLQSQAARLAAEHESLAK